MNHIFDHHVHLILKLTKYYSQMFTSDGWNVIIRGGEDCTVEPPEQPIFY